MYTNSPLASYTVLSPNNSGPRNHSIDRITPHCVVGQATARNICQIFRPRSRKASCNYAIGFNGDIALCVPEAKRSWCSSSAENDHRAVTIECASDTLPPYTMTSAVWASLVELCVDICKRNGKTKLLWLGSKSKTLAYTPKKNEMVLTVHRWFANKSCPGDWLYNRLELLADKVTEALTLPSAETPEPKYRTYVVEHGDTLYSISKRMLGAGSRYKEIMQLNGMKTTTIFIGSALKIPEK